MAKIAKLDPILSSQIAAGEVVERPASVVKELVENSLDALSKRIIVEFEDGGLTSIKVFDDGSGMSKDDAKLSLERFATSKIGEVGDLGRISTLGFRGEALPSISSCSKLSVTTWDGKGDSGYFMALVGGVIKEERSAAAQKGTGVTVQDLFFNTPARLKFLKTKTSERRAILDAVQRLALSWPDVGFTVQSGGKTLLKTAGAGLKNAILDIFGPDTLEMMVPLESGDAGIFIKGFVGRPGLYRRARDRQFFSVYKRPVRSLPLSFSLDDAYKGVIPPENRPFVVLDIAVPHESLDVNVHPTKSEVKFKDERNLRNLMVKAIRETFEELGHLEKPREVFPVTYGGRTAGLPNPPSRVWSQPTVVRDTFKDGKSLPDGWQYLGSFHDTYLLAASPKSLLVIDKHALMESLAYIELSSGKYGSQDLLVSEIVKLDVSEQDMFHIMEENLKSMGFCARLIGERTLLVTKVPLILGKPLPANAIKEILSENSISKRDLMTAACHASVRAGESLSKEEATALILGLLETPEARTCPHGRPTVQEITYGELGRFFGRAVKPKDIK